MRRRVKAFVANLAFGLLVAAATHASTFHSEERKVWTAHPEAAAESRPPRPAPRGKAAKSRVEALPPVFTATDERHFSVSDGILMTQDVLMLARKLAADYYKLTGRKLHFTSGYRTPGRQALAMYQMLQGYGVRYYKRVYRRRRRPAGQILVAYFKNHSDRARAIGAMTLTIKSQIKNGVYVSNHLRERAFDVRSSTRRGALDVAVAQLGGRVGFEKNHYHVEL